MPANTAGKKWPGNKNLSDRIYRINMMICRAAPEEQPETHFRFTEPAGATDHFIPLL
jgi:hypothetical protein